MKTKKNIWLFYFFIMAVLGFALLMPRDSILLKRLSNHQFETILDAGDIKEVTIRRNAKVPTGAVLITLNDGEEYVYYAADVNIIENNLTEKNIDFVPQDVEKDNYMFTIGIPIAVMLAIVIFLVFIIMNRSVSGGNSKLMNLGKSRAKLLTDGTNINFENIAGLEEEKKDLEEIVDFLKDPNKYIKQGARIPKGVLLLGMPGTGKTLLAKAVAGEAKVPFFSIAGSDFSEMLVGIGAARVRGLFEEAKANAPCIIFIDEIDEVAKRRGMSTSSGNDEREQTLNQLLVEMDGFVENQGIIVLAATNRAAVLDPAILRSGRFDRKIVVGLPDVKGREAILKVHAKNKNIGNDINFETIARTTAGFTGADLENLLNEAAIQVAREDRQFITTEDIQSAFIRIGIGTEKKSKVISEKERKITAYHEAGHAILFHILPDVGSVHSVSIIPTGQGAAGYTMPLPEQDNMFRTKGQMLNEIMVYMGGRIAEEIKFDDITTGASQDIKQSTALARAMVTKYGMSEKVGTIDYSYDDNELLVLRDISQNKGYSETMAALIDTEVQEIISKCYEKAKNLIMENVDVLESTAMLLLEKEKINREEFEALFND
jgi:ATP-dependent metalloprotease FtsH